MIIDLSLIQTFLKVVKVGNLRLAAKNLFVTPPALSHRIKALEQQIGKSLFIRKKSGMELNADGRELYEICFNMQRDYEKLEKWASMKKGHISGELRLSVLPGISQYLLSDFICLFLKKYNQIQISIEAASSAYVEEMVISGGCDIGIIAGQCQKPSLKFQLLLKNNVILLVYSPKHPLANNNKPTRKDLEGVRFLWHGKPSERTTLDTLKALGLTKSEQVNFLRVPDMEVTKKLALKKLGVACIAKIYIREELKKGELIAFPNFKLNRHISLISRNEKYESPGVRVFKEEFVKYCRKFDKKLQ